MNNEVKVVEQDEETQTWQIPDDIQDEIDALVEEQAKLDERVEALGFNSN